MAQGMGMIADFKYVWWHPCLSPCFLSPHVSFLLMLNYGAAQEQVVRGLCALRQMQTVMDMEGAEFVKR